MRYNYVTLEEDVLLVDYIKARGDLFVPADPIFTNDIKRAVNWMLKHQQGQRRMIYTDPEDVVEIVDFVLLDNMLKYQNMLNLLNYTLPSDYTSKTNGIETKDNTGTQNIAGTENKANTGTQSVADTATRANTGTQTNASVGTKDNTGTQTNASVGTKDNTGTQTTATSGTKDNTGTQTTATSGTKDNTGTQTTGKTGTEATARTVGVVDSKTSTTQPKTSAKSVMGFDGGAMTEQEKTVDGLESIAEGGTQDTTESNTTTYNTTDTRTDALKETESRTDTRTDLLKEVDVRTDTRTDLLKEVDARTDTRTDLLKEVDARTDTRTDDLAESSSSSSVRTDLLNEAKNVSTAITDVENERIARDVKDLNVSVRLDELERMRENTKTLLCKTISEDIARTLCFLVW